LFWDSETDYSRRGFAGSVEVRSSIPLGSTIHTTNETAEMPFFVERYENLNLIDEEEFNNMLK
jgi:hypothetical protein